MIKINFAKFSLVLCSLLAVPTIASAQMSENLSVSNAWMPALPPVAKSAAIYMDLENIGEEALQLVAVKTDIAEKSELHTMKMENGIMRMMELEKGITLEPDSRYHLKQGGDHVMLFNLTNAPSTSDNVTLTIVFKDKSEKNVQISVK